MKNLLIGFLLGLSLLLLASTSAWNIKEVGRYQGVQLGGRTIAIVDTRTGVLRTSLEKGKLIKSSWVGEVFEYDFFGVGK